ncbi:hypothetical protein GEMRC1_004784 [Eukaryota sp. GEM-RC1]
MPQTYKERHVFPIVIISAAKSKVLRRGIREVVKSIRRETSGICLIAGNINPMDVIAHLPIFCEEKSIPYVFVPSKEELGVAASTKGLLHVFLLWMIQNWKIVTPLQKSRPKYRANTLLINHSCHLVFHFNKTFLSRDWTHSQIFPFNKLIWTHTNFISFLLIVVVSVLLVEGE